MKWPVYILLLAALTYAGETIRLPFQLAEQQAQQERQATATDQCCHRGKEKEQECPYRHKDGQHQNNNNKNGCCNTTANCSNCPLCYTAELSSIFTSACLPTVITKNYPDIPGQHLTDYTPSTWKPPNA